MSDDTTGRVVWVARAAGLLAAGVVIALSAVLVLANPYASDTLSSATGLIMGLLCALALVAAWGAIARRPLLLLLAFAASFFPLGLYLLGTPGIFRWIGVAHLVYLIVGLALLGLPRPGDPVSQ